MVSHKPFNVYRKIVSLEDKVNRLEEMMSYGTSDRYSSPYFKKITPAHYKSAVNLAEATHNFKQDLIHNPRHNKLSRENYEKIINRVLVLEDELQDIIENMEIERLQSDYNYEYNRNSQSMHHKPLYIQERDISSRRIREPQRKHILYNKYIEVIPNETSSSESIEEIVYYVESSTSSSSSVIVEEYVPKTYTRRSVHKAPVFDVSKSKPSPSIERSPQKPKWRRKISEPELSVHKQPKGTKRTNIKQSRSKSDNPNEKSELFLVKRKKDLTKQRTKGQKEKDKFFISRLKRAESSDKSKYTNRNGKKSSSRRANKTSSDNSVFQQKSKTSNYKGIKESRSRESNRKVKLENSNRRKSKQKSQPSKQSKDSVTVAYGSCMLNDPFIRTRCNDDYQSSEDDNTNYKSNNNSNKSSKNTVRASGIEHASKSNNHSGSIYEVSNSIYTFDPFFKHKRKFYSTDNQNFGNIHNLTNNMSDKKRYQIHNVSKSDIIVLNSDNLEPFKQKFTLKQRKNSNNVDRIVERYGMFKNKNSSASILNKDIASERKLSKYPLAHSVYLTTVPVYEKSCKALQSSFNSTKESENMTKSKQKHSSKKLNLPLEIVEDEILMNVARKLSPVVAQIITNKYLDNEGKYESLSESSITNVHNSRSNCQLDQLNGKQQNSSSMIVDRKTIDSRKEQFNPRHMKNEPSVELINISGRNTGPELSMYFTSLDDNSPLVKETNSRASIRKTTLKKEKSLSVLKNIFPKVSQEKTIENNVASRFSPQNMEFVALQIKPKQINRNSTNRLSTMNMVGDRLAEPLHINSVDRNVLRKKSILRNPSVNNEKKPRFRSMIKKVRSRGEITQETEEPALLGILKKLKGNKSSNILKRSVSQELNLPKKNSSIQSLKKDSVSSKRNQSKYSTKDQNIKPSLTKVLSRQAPSLLNVKNRSITSPDDTLLNGQQDAPTHLVNLSQDKLSNKGISNFTNGEELSDESSREVLSDTRADLRQTRSVSGYFNQPVIRNSEPKTSKLHQARVSRTEIDLDLTVRKSNSVTEVSPQEKDRSLNNVENASLHDNNYETPKAEPDKLMKPLGFCIHFSKEKRSRFESQSISSLDDILSSRCKKIYSSEDLSLSEYAWDKDSKLYRVFKLNPKNPKNFFKRSLEIRNSTIGRNSIKNCVENCPNLKNNYCCKNSNNTNNEPLISYVPNNYTNWQRIANEIKQAQ